VKLANGSVQRQLVIKVDNLVVVLKAGSVLKARQSVRLVLVSQWLQ